MTVSACSQRDSSLSQGGRISRTSHPAAARASSAAVTARRTLAVTDGSASCAASTPMVRDGSPAWPDGSLTFAYRLPGSGSSADSAAMTGSNATAPATVAVSVPTWSQLGDNGYTPATGTSP